MKSFGQGASAIILDQYVFAACSVGLWRSSRPRRARVRSFAPPPLPASHLSLASLLPPLQGCRGATAARARARVADAGARMLPRAQQTQAQRTDAYIDTHATCTPRNARA